MRKTPLVEGEYYHVFNRGVDKRTIFSDESDFQRFLKSMREFNVVKPIGSIYENSFRKSKSPKESDKPLVEFVAYCLNPNHYHFILCPVVANGIEKFIHKLNMGYAKYFNEKYKRSGVLFQGPFRSVHVRSNEQLLYLSAYVNLNYLVHGLGHGVSKSSWEEYIGMPKVRFCDKSLVKEQLRDVKDYQKMALETVREIKEKRDARELLLE